MFKKIFNKIYIALHGIVMFILGKAPKRIIPTGNNIISPAHGKIIEIRSVQNSDIIFEKKGIQNHVVIPELIFPARIIIIEMTPLDVHVQRAPITGSILRMDHYHGGHKNAMGKSMLEIVEENEKVIALFSNKKEKVAVIQVAGLAARRIRNILEVGDEIDRGDIYGRIKFGSLVVIIIPYTRKISVMVGEKVVDGETILAW